MTARCSSAAITLLRSNAGGDLAGVVLHLASRSSFPYLWAAEGLKYLGVAVRCHGIPQRGGVISLPTELSHIVQVLYFTLCDP